MKTPIREWEIDAPWGKISLTSWGNTDAPPVFMAHGRQDCAVTFQPVLQLMPDDEYHYVAIDMPGSGSSTHLPVGVNQEEIAANIPDSTLTTTSEHTQEVVENMDKEEVIQNSNKEEPNQAISSTSTSTGGNGLPTTACPQNMINQEQAAQSMSDDVWPDFTDFEDPEAARIKLIEAHEIIKADIALRLNEEEEVLQYNSKIDYVVVEMGDTSLSDRVDDNEDYTSEIGDDDYKIIEVDPNCNLPAFFNPNMNLMYDERMQSDLCYELNANEGDGEDDNIQGEILDTKNKHLLKAGDEIFHEETRQTFKIILSEPLQSYCVRVFTKAEKNARDVKRYRIGINSPIEFVAISQNDLQQGPSENDFDSPFLGIIQSRDLNSAVPSNSPEDMGDEGIVPRPTLGNVTVDVDMASQMFEELNVELRETQSDKLLLTENEEAKEFVFPKYIKCNDHGVDGTCPFARQSAFSTPPKTSSTRFHDPEAFQRDDSPTVLMKTPNDTLPTLLNTSEPLNDELKGGMEAGPAIAPIHKKKKPESSKNAGDTTVRFRSRSQRAPKAHLKRANQISIGGLTCLCICLDESNENCGPLSWLADCFRCGRQRRSSRRHRRHRHHPSGNNVLDTYHPNDVEYTIVSIIYPLMMVPFESDYFYVNPTTPACNVENAAAYNEENMYQDYVTPRPSEEDGSYEDYLPDDLNFYEEQYGQPRGFNPMVNRPPPQGFAEQYEQAHVFNPRSMPPPPGFGQCEHHFVPVMNMPMAPPLVPFNYESYVQPLPLIPMNRLMIPAPHPLGVGTKIMRFHFLGAMEVALEHLGWDKFIFIGHSMGCEQGLFYNTIYPGRITKMIFLDAEPTLRRLQMADLSKYQAKFYDDYYNNYNLINYRFKTYTKTQAIKALMKARNLTEDKASVIASKCLIHVKDDQYRFTWGNRLKSPAPQNYLNTYYFALFKTIPPTLLISASESFNSTSIYRAESLELIRMMETLKDFSHVTVKGDHDVHLSHPERVASYINDFLRKKDVICCKL